MAGGMNLEAGKAGGKKSLDTAINLVPFIDLMAVTISFLIMTAVWNQIARLKISQSGTAVESKAPPSPALPIYLLIAERGFSITAGGNVTEIPKRDGRFVYCHASGADAIDDRCDEHSLVAALRKLKDRVPEQQSITVQCEDAITYDVLVRVIDVCNLKDSALNPVLFPEVAVSAAS